jgi:hypothetical protein
VEGEGRGEAPFFRLAATTEEAADSGQAAHPELALQSSLPAM